MLIRCGRNYLWRGFIRVLNFRIRIPEYNRLTYILIIFFKKYTKNLWCWELNFEKYDFFVQLIHIIFWIYHSDVQFIFSYLYTFCFFMSCIWMFFVHIKNLKLLFQGNYRINRKEDVLAFCMKWTQSGLLQEYISTGQDSSGGRDISRKSLFLPFFSFLDIFFVGRVFSKASEQNIICCLCVYMKYLKKLKYNIFM